MARQKPHVWDLYVQIYQQVGQVEGKDEAME